MFTVAIKNAQFNAPIGLYEQELKTFNLIGVDVSVSQKAAIQDLPFIDYTSLYQLVKNSIDKHFKTLEEVLSAIYQEIKTIYPESLINIQVRKYHPPISGQVDYTAVSFED